MIHVRMLSALCLVLLLVMVGVLVLNAFSSQARLSQTAFIYEIDISKLNLSFPKFAPISIAPTLISIIVGLWWDQLDATFRTLQPYISMSHGPTPICAGAGLTYRSKSWVGAAFKAARHRHWVLFIVTVGSILAQVLTVSMSAVFEKRIRNVALDVSLQSHLKIRESPFISEILVETKRGVKSKDPRMMVLNELFTNSSQNWLYGAGVQHSFDGAKLPWTSDGWSFLPMNLSSLTQDSNTATLSSLNISFVIPAIRARLDCSPIEEISNVSAWIEPANLTFTDAFEPDAVPYVNGSNGTNLYTLPRNMFEGTSAQTSVLSTANVAVCCANGTMNDPQRAIMGYWSPTIPLDSQSDDVDMYPYQDMPWPLSIATKWIVGKPISMPRLDGTQELYYRGVPRIQAAQCVPIIETAEASILLDVQTEMIHYYEIRSPLKRVDRAWANVLEQRERINKTYTGPLNITTSFGVLFLESLLGAGDRRQEIFPALEDLQDDAFVLRDQTHGTNMDLMTRSMYNLAGQDVEALLNYTKLVDFANLTFQAFFQQFVSTGLSLDNGGYVYETVNGEAIAGLSSRIHGNSTANVRRETSTTESIEATTSHSVQILHMNTIASYISVGILTWLIMTTFIVICLQRKYTGGLLRDVQLIADVLVLVAGSDNFLELIEQKGVALKKSRDIKTMLGWFQDRDGQTRWGIEVVGGRQAVDWVDAPKDGWHVRDAGP